MGGLFSNSIYEEDYHARYAKLTQEHQRLFDRQYELVREYFNGLSDRDVCNFEWFLGELKCMRSFFAHNYDHYAFPTNPENIKQRTNEYKIQCFLKELAWLRLEMIEPKIASIFDRPERLNKREFLMYHTIEQFQQARRYRDAGLRYRIEEFIKQ